MPKAAGHALLWSQNRSRYELVEPGTSEGRPIHGAEAA
jgi:hypothetical protein